MSWDGKERRRPANKEFSAIERDRLLTQIDTRLEILINTFDAHEKEDDKKFEDHDKRIREVHAIYSILIAVIIVFEFYQRYFSK